MTVIPLSFRTAEGANSQMFVSVLSITTFPSWGIISDRSVDLSVVLSYRLSRLDLITYTYYVLECVHIFPVLKTVHITQYTHEACQFKADVTDYVLPS